jgi:hypothetical protein
MDALPITKNMVSYSIYAQKLAKASNIKTGSLYKSINVTQLRDTARSCRRFFKQVNSK